MSSAVSKQGISASKLHATNKNQKLMTENECQMTEFVLMLVMPCHWIIVIASFAYFSHEIYFSQPSAAGIELEK